VIWGLRAEGAKEERGGVKQRAEATEVQEVHALSYIYNISSLLPSIGGGGI